MPKRAKTPPVTDEGQYLAIHQPYPLNVNFEIAEEVIELCRWIASCIGRDWVHGIHHMRSANGLCLVEINTGCKELNTKLLGEHRWRDFLVNPTEEEKTRVSQIFYSRFKTLREAQKAGWKFILAEDKWFENLERKTPHIVRPYPQTYWCAAPVKDITNGDVCRPLPSSHFQPPVKPPPPVVGTAAWAEKKATPAPKPSKAWNQRNPGQLIIPPTSVTAKPSPSASGSALSAKSAWGPKPPAIAETAAAAVIASPTPRQVAPMSAPSHQAAPPPAWGPSKTSTASPVNSVWGAKKPAGVTSPAAPAWRAPNVAVIAPARGGKRVATAVVSPTSTTNTPLSPPGLSPVPSRPPVSSSESSGPSTSSAATTPSTRTVPLSWADAVEEEGYFAQPPALSRGPSSAPSTANHSSYGDDHVSQVNSDMVRVVMSESMENTLYGEVTYRNEDFNEPIASWQVSAMAGAVKDDLWDSYTVSEDQSKSLWGDEGERITKPVRANEIYCPHHKTYCKKLCQEAAKLIRKQELEKNGNKGGPKSGGNPGKRSTKSGKPATRDPLPHKSGEGSTSTDGWSSVKGGRKVVETVVEDEEDEW